MQNELAGAMRVAEEAFSSMLTVRSMAAEPLVCSDFGDALRDRCQVLTYDGEESESRFGSHARA